MPKFLKSVLTPDTYRSPDGTVRVTPARIRHWVDSFRRMKEAGLKIPVPWGHLNQAKPEDPDEAEFLRTKYNAGFLDHLAADESGQMIAVIDVPLAEDAQRVGTVVQEVSPQIEREFIDGKGRTWTDTITHLALCQQGVVAGQENFRPAAADPLPKAALRLSLSQRVTRMATEKVNPHDLEDEEKDNGARGDEYPSEDELDGDQPPFPEKVDESDAGAAKHFHQAKGMLKEHFGIHLPDDTDHQKGWEHLCIALHALANQENEGKGKGKPDHEAETAPAREQQPKEEQPMLSLSLKRKFDSMAEKLATAELKAHLADIDTLVEKGQTSPAKAKSWKESLGKHRLSLASDGNAQTGRVLAEIAFAKEVPIGTFWDPEVKSSKARFATEQTGLEWRNEPITAERARKIADEQMGVAGHR